MVFNGIENELIIITKQTFDTFLRSEFPADLIALYNFYYYTAKWQETNQPKCTTGYTAEGLKWSEAKVRRAKKELMRLGLVEDVQQKVNGKVTGCFIKLNYILKQETINHPYDFSQGGKEENHPYDFSQGGKEENHPYDFSQGGVIHRVENLRTNALSSNNINALSSDKRKTKKSFESLIDAYTENEKLKSSIRDFIEFRKQIKSPLTEKALTLSFNKLDKLAGADDELKISIINQSIERGWRGLFEVKETVKPASSASDYDIQDISQFWK